jgi:hypothetical protein
MGLLKRGKRGTTAPADGTATGVVPGHSGLGPVQAAGAARMAVFSGIAFAVLFTLGLVLVNQIPRLGSPDNRYAAFYTNGSGGVMVTAGLYLVPFAGTAFSWFMMAFRALIDRPAHIAQGLQLASGVALVRMLFAGPRPRARCR